MSDWANFYVIVGSAGGALIGLQFVVMTLIAGRPLSKHTGALSAFGTPTVVHLTGALLFSAIMTAPWPSLTALSYAIAACGAGGLVYGAIVTHRARRQTEYEPVWQDWLWYHVLPFAAYGTLTIAAFFLRAGTRSASFFVAAAVLGLLLIGIHNAWDTVTHIIVTQGDGD
jgi:hypothetical protein